MDEATTTSARQVERVIALGASNLTRGFQPLVAEARARWGRDVEVLAALGHGRSYGATSRFGLRSLPGILQSGLWQELDRLPLKPARGLITDLGNDLLYGSTPEQILEWVAECVSRLRAHAQDIALADLPMSSIERVSRARYALFRTLLFPRCRSSLEAVQAAAEVLSRGLAVLARSEGLRLCGHRPEWYGFDPIHILPRYWRRAWREILGSGEASGADDTSVWNWEALRLYVMPPERRCLLGMDQLRQQTGLMLPRGGRVWLF